MVRETAVELVVTLPSIKLTNILELIEGVIDSPETLNKTEDWLGTVLYWDGCRAITKFVPMSKIVDL